MEPTGTESNHQQAIQLMAYHLWQQRGCPFGSPGIVETLKGLADSEEESKLPEP